MKTMLLCGCCLVASFGQASGSLVPVWHEDFNDDPVPPWTNTDLGFYWDLVAIGEALQVNIYKTNTGVFSRPAMVTVDQDDDFALTIDPWTFTYMYYSQKKYNVMVANGTGSGQAGFQVRGAGGTFPSTAQLWAQIQDSAGTWYESDTPVEVGIRANALLTLSYTSADRTLSLSSSLGGSTSVALPAGRGFSLDCVKFHTFGAGDSQRITAYMDNVTFSVAPQPMTLILLGLGGLLVRGKAAKKW